MSLAFPRVSSTGGCGAGAGARTAEWASVRALTTALASPAKIDAAMSDEWLAAEPPRWSKMRRVRAGV